MIEMKDIENGPDNEEDEVDEEVEDHTSGGLSRPSDDGANP